MAPTCHGFGGSGEILGEGRVCTKRIPKGDKGYQKGTIILVATRASVSIATRVNDIIVGALPSSTVTKK